MIYHFCTIASPDYLPFVQTLFYSLKKQSDRIVLHALITSNEKPENKDSIIYYMPGDFNEEIVMETVQKYQSHNDFLRWALKPFFLSYLLNKTDRVIYLDNDIYFYKPFDFLFEQLQHHSLLLTPHWLPFDPYPEEELFKSNYQLGLFNAGFIGAGVKSINVLKWWSKACSYNIERNFCEGFFVDQRYLDLSLIVDSEIGIVRHLGCNVGSWNIHQNKRTLMNKEVYINGEYPIVFIHFNHETIKHILNGNDVLLRPLYDEYEKAFSLTGFQLSQFKDHAKKVHPAIQIKRKLMVRTRIKKLLFRLSQKL